LVNRADVSSVFVVAIDGPAGAGKSTIGRALAARLGLEYLDTGAMYRSVTVAAMRDNVDVTDSEAVAALARRIEIHVGSNGVRVDGIDVTEAIRTPEVNALVSTVAANASVRAEMVQRQRSWARERGGGVLEGRDIGSVVFPDARLKVFLTASADERAQRRALESGGDVQEIADSIRSRDRKDSERAVAPLAEAEGAIVVDTTGRPVEDVLEELLGLLGVNP
jgi:cytidylate kinase